MKLKRFNELNEATNEENVTVKIKDIIEYLNKFDPESPVYLDHDGWLTYKYEAVDVQDIIERRGIFDYWDGRLTINN